MPQAVSDFPPSPRLAVMLTPPTAHSLRLMKQVGAEELVIAYPGTRETLEPQAVQRVCDQAGEADLKVSVIERGLPHDQLVHGGTGWSQQITLVKQLIEQMGRAGVGVLCYNWMPDDDWSRTHLALPERGGALVTGFDLAEVAHEALDRLPSGEIRSTARTMTRGEDLWKNLERFLSEIIPVAESHGVKLALHPDDPPLSPFRGQDRIIIDHAATERALNLHDSPAHALCYCQGTYASAGENVVAAIPRFAPRTAFVHFRDVVGQVPAFREAFHDTGKTDMAAAMEAWVTAGFAGPIRPDHVPTLVGEDNSTPGYHVLGRLWALGYMRGLREAALRHQSLFPATEKGQPAQ